MDGISYLAGAGTGILLYYSISLQIASLQNRSPALWELGT